MVESDHQHIALWPSSSIHRYNISDSQTYQPPKFTEIQPRTLPSNTPASRPKLPESIHQYSSRLDVSQGPLRATSDGVLVKEQIGGYVNLDLPLRNRDAREPAPTTSGATTKAPIIELPKASNGGNGLDDPRKQKSVKQLSKDV